MAYNFRALVIAGGAGSATAGGVTTTPPSDPGQTVRRVGYTWSDDSFRIDLGEPIFWGS